MRKTVTAAIALLSCVLGGAISAPAGDRFVIRASSDAIADICQNYNLQLIRDLGRPYLYLVTGPDGVSTKALQAKIAADPRVQQFERDGTAVAPEATANPTAATPIDSPDRSPTDFFGAT